MQWSRESRQTAAAVVVLAFGLALLAAPSLLTRNTNAQEVPAAAHGQASSTRDQGECLAAAAQAKQLLDSHRGDSGTLAQAHVRIEAAMRTRPACPELYIEQARLLMKSGGLDPTVLRTAEQSLRKGLKLVPGHGDTQVLLGYVLTHQFRYDEAAAAFDAARRASAGSPWLELNHGELLLAQGKVDEGLRHYQTAIDDPAIPEYVRAQAVQAMARQFARDGRHAETQEAYEKLLAEGHDDAWTLGNYSRVLRVNLLDTARSLEMGRRALQKMDYGWGRQNLGATLYLAWAEALISKKNPTQASELYAEAQQYLESPATLLHEVYLYPRAHPIIEALKQKGYSLDHMPELSIGSGGDTPLTMAASGGNHAVVRQLLDAGASPDISGYGGITALMFAARRGDANLVRELLKHGADPTLREAQGNDAEAIARSVGQTETAQLIASAKKSRKPAATNEGVGANGLPLIAYRYRTLRELSGASGTGGQLPAGEIVTFKGTNGMLDEHGNHDPSRMWLNFQTDDGGTLSFEQQVAKLDWRTLLEPLPPL